jgi:hypothetical protein
MTHERTTSRGRSDGPGHVIHLKRLPSTGAAASAASTTSRSTASRQGDARGVAVRLGRGTLATYRTSAAGRISTLVDTVDGVDQAARPVRGSAANTDDMQGAIARLETALNEALDRGACAVVASSDDPADVQVLVLLRGNFTAVIEPDADGGTNVWELTELVARPAVAGDARAVRAQVLRRLAMRYAVVEGGTLVVGRTAKVGGRFASLPGELRLQQPSLLGFAEVRPGRLEWQGPAAASIDLDVNDRPMSNPAATLKDTHRNQFERWTDGNPTNATNAANPASLNGREAYRSRNERPTYPTSASMNGSDPANFGFDSYAGLEGLEGFDSPESALTALLTPRRCPPGSVCPPTPPLSPVDELLRDDPADAASDTTDLTGPAASDPLCLAAEFNGIYRAAGRSLRGGSADPAAAEAACFELARALGACELAGLKPAAAHVLAPAAAVVAARALVRRLQLLDKSLHALGTALKRQPTNRLRESCLSAVEARVDAWQAYVALDSAWNDYLSHGPDDPAAHDAFQQSVDAVLDALAAADQRLEALWPNLRLRLSGTHLCGNLLACYVAAGALAPWWLDESHTPAAVA